MRNSSDVIRTVCSVCACLFLAFSPAAGQERVTVSARLLTGRSETEHPLRFVPAPTGEGDRQVRLESGPYVGAQLQFGVTEFPVFLRLGVVRTVDGALEYQEYRQAACGENCTRVESTFAPGAAASSTWWSASVMARSPDIGRLRLVGGIGAGLQLLEYDVGNMTTNVSGAFPGSDKEWFRTLTLGAEIDIVRGIILGADVSRVRSGFWFAGAADPGPRSTFQPQSDNQYSVGIAFRLF